MAGLVLNKHVSSDTQEEDNSSGNAMVKVKLEKSEAELLGTCGIQKRKRLSRSRPRRFTEQGENTLEGQKKKQPRLTTRWNIERISFAEQTLADVMKEKGASLQTPISRRELRTIARKQIGDTGLLDHLLKHIEGNVTPGGVDRFRRCYNTEGTMEYWLESADLVKIKHESETPDPNWIPPSWWKFQSASHESSAVSSKFKEEIEKMKSDISKELVSKQPDHAYATEKLYKDLMSWRVKTDKQIEDLMSWKVKTEKQIMEISNSLTSTQELISWKDKVEHQFSNSQNLQANGRTSFSPASESWEHILQSANWDGFTEKGFEPWDVDNVLPEAVKPNNYSLPPNPYKNTFQNQMWFEEQSLLNTEPRRTERSSNQEKADITPGSSMTAGPRSDNDDPNSLPKETLKELVSWKTKVEQQLTEMSNAVLALQEPNWLYQ